MSTASTMKFLGRDAARISATYTHGDAAYVRYLQRALPHTTKPATLDQLTDAVARKLGVHRDWILSSSRRRDATLARALITWYAVENSIATQRAVCEWLQRDPSTLFVACERYRRSHRHLFRQELTELLDHEQHHEPVPVVTQ